MRALYEQAGLSLDADLDTLAASPRVAAASAAVHYLEKYIVYNGDLDMPVLTMHTIGDGLVLPQDEQAYASVVRSDGDQSLLRQIFVSRAGHCAFTPGETVAAFQTLIGRLKTGHWGASTSPAGLDAIATGPRGGAVQPPAGRVRELPSLAVPAPVRRQEPRRGRRPPGLVNRWGGAGLQSSAPAPQPAAKSPEGGAGAGLSGGACIPLPQK